MHYNEGADLLTYLADPSVFAIREGYVEALTGLFLLIVLNIHVLTRNRARLRNRNK